jgi:Tfp pilus assembly protein PilP
MRKLAAILALLFLCGADAWAQEEEKAGENKYEIKKDIYIYKSGNRRDPFLSIVTAAQIEQDKEKKKGVLPLEAFDIRQMRLVAIVKDQSAKDFYALLGMPDGKFYTIKKGVPLGLHDGKVASITLNKVVVREKIRNYKGELISQDTVLRLRKGEEE